MKIFSLLALMGMADALDLMFDHIQCDTSLPAYAYEDDITMECSGEKKCSFGDTALISGNIYYENLEYSGLKNATGYASADLQLMTLQYDLFQFLPFKFCGDWVTRGKYNFNSCPGDGKYHFEVPYVLPKNDDATTWFATGWEGVSYLKIYAGRSDNSPLLSNCKIHFKTSVTQSNEENWKTLPSAAQTTLILFGIAAGMFSLIICLACRTRRKHPTDEDYSQDFKKMEDPAPKKKEEEVQVQEAEEKPKETIEERVHNLSVNMDYNV